MPQYVVVMCVAVNCQVASPLARVRTGIHCSCRFKFTGEKCIWPKETVVKPVARKLGSLLFIINTKHVKVHLK